MSRRKGRSRSRRSHASQFRPEVLEPRTLLSDLLRDVMGHAHPGFAQPLGAQVTPETIRRLEILPIG